MFDYSSFFYCYIKGQTEIVYSYFESFYTDYIYICPWEQKILIIILFAIF